MSAHLTLTLDTAPPASPTLLVNDGALLTGTQVVALTLATPSPDVAEMKIWGDLDPTADARFQVAEADSAWSVFAEEIPVRLAPGDGLKRVYARLRDDVLNETPAFTDAITLDLTSAVVTVVSPPDRTRLSLVSPCDRATFSWQASQPFDQYEVRVVPMAGSPRSAGTVLPTEGGSANTSGVGSFLADTPVTTAVDAADLRTASPGDTAKVVKVFVRGTGGVWSS